MARYEISHPELPQLGGILELPDGEQPTERHFWEAAQTQLRPRAAGQLSDKARITAMRNGFFDLPDIPILDVEDDPDTLQDEAQPGLLTGLADMGKDFLIKTNPLTSPYSKVLQLDDEPVNYKNDHMARQMREAGKRLFGLLDNTESLSELGFDPIDEALKQVGLPRGMRKEAGFRGMAKAAALDYATGNVEVSVGMGVVRAAQTSLFVAQGARHLTNWALLDEMDDGDALAFANSAIAFDKVNYEHEHAAELAAWVLENPTDALKATGGVAPKEMAFDSELERDVRSGYQEPSEGMGLFTEVVADPLNLAGAWSAKAVTSPFRIGLKGRILKTLGEVQSKTLELTKLDTALKALPEDALVRGRIVERAAKISEELVEQKKILDKFGDRSLLLRLAGKSSPETLGKVALETFDQSTDAGRLGMSMVIDATKATDDMGKLRKAAHLAAKVNPEIMGATVGGMIAGPVGAVAGAALPSVIKVGRFLSALPENVAIRYIITGARNAGEEITEQAARQRYRTLKSRAGYGLVGASAIGFSVDQDMLGGSAGVMAIAALIGPKALSMMDNLARDARVIGPELILAQTKEPFFRRVAALPTPEQGLAGATRDRFNLMTQAGPEGLLGRVADATAQGSKAAFKEVAPAKLPFRVDRAGNPIGEAPFISPTAKKMANFLDKPGRFGRLGTPVEALGRFGKGMAAGASIPATIGFVASAGQPSGALAGAIMSAPFTALGAGVGLYDTFKSGGDLYAKQIGDVQYYREHLGKRERAEFDSLPAHIRSMVAGYSLSHPDVVFKQTKEGGGNFDPQTMEVSYNPDAGGFLQGTMAHEITHFVELHGLMPMVNRILFGNKETKTAGEFASYDKDGNAVYSKEFTELREIYLDRMRKDPSIDPENVVEYEANPQKIGREIFADLGADYLLTGKRGKVLDTGPLGKLVGATIDGITGVGFIRDFLLKLNMPLNAEGKFVTSTDLFKGKLKKIPEIERLLDKYYKDVRALRKSQIEGEEFTDPATGKKRETEGARPLDDEFDTLYSVEDQRNPNVVDKLNTGGLFKVNPKTGEVEKDAMGRPVGMTKKELEKVDNSAGDHAAKVFEENGIEITVDEKTGRSFSEDVGPLNEKIIDELARGPWHPRQIATLREISRALQAGDGERAGLLLGYFSATAGRKPKAVPFKMRQAFPFGLRLERQGNINVLLHDVDQLHKNLKFLKGETKGLPPELRGMYDKLFETDNAVWDAFHQYRDNMNAGINGRTGLDLDPVIADKKLNFLNALHGGLDKAHVEMNPILRAIGSQMATINLKKNPFGVALRTFRLDRIFSAERSGTGSGFSYERAKTLASPEGKKLFSPQMEMDFSPPKQSAPEAKPNFWKIYKIDPKGPKVYDEVADVLIQAGSPWMDGSIVESQAGLLRLNPRKLRQAMTRAHGRWDRGDGKQFMPADDRPLGLPDNIRDEVLPGIRQDKFSRGQLEAALGKTAGAKAYAEEIGLIDWLKDRKSVTKSEVDQFVKENAPRLEEKLLGEATFNKELNIWQHQFDRLPDGEPKFSDYQEPGGTNYREVVIKLEPKFELEFPSYEKWKDEWILREGEELADLLTQARNEETNRRVYESEKKKADRAAQTNYHEPHFNEDNVLLHLRLNDRIDADGKKVLFIEELQSDWHQKGRKRGYAKPVDVWEVRFPASIRSSDFSPSQLYNQFKTKKRAEDVMAILNKDPSWGEHSGFTLEHRTTSGGVPDAPFKKNWPALGLKRAIKEALEGGYDKVAWLDGEGQAARYDLSRQVDAIEVIRDGDGTYEIMARPVDEMGGKFQTLETKVPKEKLADYIGKEPAKKALEKMEDGLAHLEGLDLKVGGEGMKSFYDRELVSVANKISKKIGGGKVRRETIPRGEGFLSSEAKRTLPISHVLDLPKNPQAVENLRLFMPAEKAPSDSRPPAILRDKQFMPSDPKASKNTYLNEIKRGNIDKAVSLLDKKAKDAGFIKVVRVLPENVDPKTAKPIGHADWVVPDNEIGHSYLEEYAGENWKQRVQYAYVKEDYLVDQQTGFERKQTYTVGDTRLNESTGELYLNPKDIDSNAIKSADPVIYDSKGKPIPLSKRFDSASRNINYMPADPKAPKAQPGPGDTTPASVQSWDGANPIFATKLTKGMAKDNKEVAALLRQVYEDTFGEPLRAQDFSDTEVSWLADMLATEGEAALGRTGNAVNWYTSAVERALSIAEEIFPDIGKKFEAKDRFLGALSITSQSMRVLDNAKAAEMQYEHKQRTGKFNYDVKHGAVAEAITQNLKMYDQVEAKMGIEAFHKFLDRDFTVKKLSEWGKDFFKDKDFSIAGYQTDKVKGSAVFGPKIGQGFFQNLRGNYDPVTVDLWLRRTYGRLTGLALDTALTPKDIGRIIYSVRRNVGKRKFVGLELPKFLQGLRITGKLQKDGVANFKISDKSFEALFGDNTIGRDNTEAFFDFADKLNRGWERKFSKAGTDVKKANDAIRKAKKDGRGFANLEKKLAKLEVEKEATGKEKPQWAKAGSTVTGKLKPIDVPSNAERAVITKAFNKALAQLKAKGIDLTPADLQATLWYPEKDIWGYLKGDKSDALNMSYDTAMEIIRDQRK